MMKGLVIWKDGHASLEEMKKPEIGEYQALVRVTAGALCGTDKEIIYDVLKGFHNYPTVLGHEGVGRVEAVGSKVFGLPCFCTPNRYDKPPSSTGGR